jgi:hypothetical protein
MLCVCVLVAALATAAQPTAEEPGLMPSTVTAPAISGLGAAAGALLGSATGLVLSSAIAGVNSVGATLPLLAAPPIGATVFGGLAASTCTRAPGPYVVGAAAGLSAAAVTLVAAVAASADPKAFVGGSPDVTMVVLLLAPAAAAGVAGAIGGLVFAGETVEP